MGKKKSYRAWTQDQMFLMPPSMKEWLKEDHLAWFILDVVSEVDISPVEKAIQRKDARGQRPYDPRMMVAPLALGTEAWVSTERQRHGGEERSNSETSETDPPDGETEPADVETDPLKRMRSRLASEEGRALYARRKAVVEPVNGQIKHARGFRQFSFRGLEAAGAEWALVCMCHNLLKMFRNRPKEAPAAPARSAAAPLAREERSEASAVRLGVLLLCLSRPAGILVSSPHTPNRYRNQPGSANPGPPAPVNPAQQLQPPSHLRPGKRLRRTDS